MWVFRVACCLLVLRRVPQQSTRHPIVSMQGYLASVGSVCFCYGSGWRATAVVVLAKSVVGCFLWSACAEDCVVGPACVEFAFVGGPRSGRELLQLGSWHWTQSVREALCRTYVEMSRRCVCGRTRGLWQSKARSEVVGVVTISGEIPICRS